MDKKEELYRQMVKQARTTNAKLLRLKGHLGTQYTWAGKRMLDYLSNENVNAVTQKGFVKFNKNMSIGQMRAVIKATDNFLKSKTSTPEGVQSNVTKIQQGISKSLMVTNETAEAITKFFASEDYKQNSEVKYEQMMIAVEISQKGGDFNDYYETLKLYNDTGADEDIKRDLKPIFDLIKTEGKEGIEKLDFNDITF